MHEISLVRNIFKEIEEAFPGKTAHVRSIHLTVGLLSNVQPVLMQNAFEAVLKAAPHYQKISLHVAVLPILIYCSACDKTTEVKHYTFVCSCGKPSKNIIQGEEMLITKIEFEASDPDPDKLLGGKRETSDGKRET